MIMANGHQQPSFKFKTAIANYVCEHNITYSGQEKWDVTVVYNSTELLTGKFSIPISWSRSMVFRWLSDMELSEL